MSEAQPKGWLWRWFREPVSGLSHLAGAVASAVGLIVLVYLAVKRGTVWHIVSYSVFGASLVLLYTASSLYHLLKVSPRGVRILRRIDHMMIYVLIAGSYTPYCLIALRGVWGWTMLAVVWGLAIIGIVVKIFWLDAPRWVTAGFYLAMGWMVVTASGPLLRAIPTKGLWWLVASGLFYTVGAILYATKRPRLWPGVFGFHEVWHLFVIAGSLSHFMSVYQLLG
jgi:hemolysin III